MKWILGLLIGMLIASPAFGQLTRDEAQTLLTGFARLTAKVEKMNEELVTVKTDIAVIKNDIAVLKTGLRDDQNENSSRPKPLTQGIRCTSQVTASEEKTSAEIRGITRQLSFVQFLLVALVTGLLTVLLAFLKNQWDKRKEGDEKLGAQQKELTEQQKALAEKQSEIDALRAENERMKNTSGLVSPSGGRLENESERERA